jgi:hypothetical protein
MAFDPERRAGGWTRAFAITEIRAAKGNARIESIAGGPRAVLPDERLSHCVSAVGDGHRVRFGLRSAGRFLGENAPGDEQLERSKERQRERAFAEHGCFRTWLLPHGL